MDEIVHQLVTILRGIWHRRWIGLAAAWIAAIIGVAVALRVPDRYEASARVFVDTQTLLRPLMEGLSIQPNVEQQVVLMSRTLISRPNVEKLIRMADLDLGARSSAQREDLIDAVSKNLRLSGGTGSQSANIYAITYRDSNPEQARKVVQSLLTIFVESSLGDKRQDTRAAMRFVDDQIKQYEDNLKAAENRLKEFRLKYLGVTGQQGGTDYFGRLAKLSDEIDNARVQLRAAEQARDAYKKELAGEIAVYLPDAPDSRAAAILTPALSAIDTRLAALRTELDNLTRRFTDEHPDVVFTKRNIELLEEQRQQELNAMRKAAAQRPSGSAGSERNPVFQQLRVSLAEAEANVASLRAKLSSYETQYAQLRSAARLVPQVEAEYTQLNRDYDIQKKTFEALLARKQSATIGEGVQDFGGTQFRVVDPPRVSPQPIPPTRIVLLAMALGVALVAGVLVAFVASQLMPTFHDARSLQAVTKRPLLGMITMLPTEALSRLRRRNAMLFAGGLGSLLVSFAAVFASMGFLARLVG